MPRYLVTASYTPEGVRGLLKEGGTARRASVQRAIESAGGRLESFYFGFGEHDAYVIADLPSNVDATAVALRVSASGLASARTVVLITPEEVDEAAGRSVDYKPPGG